MNRDSDHVAFLAYFFMPIDSIRTPIQIIFRNCSETRSSAIEGEGRLCRIAKNHAFTYPMNIVCYSSSFKSNLMEMCPRTFTISLYNSSILDME